MTSSTFAGSKFLSIGGSRNIGYHSAVRILAKGGTVTFLLRNPTCFDADVNIQGYVASGRARLVKGDALVRADVSHAWAEAAKGEGEQRVDVLLFTVGATAGKFSLTKGFLILPPNLVTQSLLTTLSTIPDQTTPPKIITISSTGLTKSSHASLPLPLKPLYSWFLAGPHEDKVGAEKVVAYCSGRAWDKEDGDAGADIMGAGWDSEEGVEGLPRGTLQDIVVVRPALLMNGACKADDASTRKHGKARDAYKVKEGDIGGWTVSRKDVAHFLVEGVLGDWARWKGKCVSIGY
ncbi:hypothetical protein FIBSPDRAFT_893628 [Athelia psychrophila]|uniref:NAD(P)-binding domain-containing protein n=1 Tax=Athelia psychrophila TaxID=1759441 RepID=A0A166GYB8_9AGAM|nr:hypothetical protein FIBSPDRAFT_893628 [Fibularhizoctonia sp. CBS 109695]